MSAKKRVFDKDLGVELVLDDEIVEQGDSKREPEKDQAEGWTRKRARLEASQSNSTSQQQQQQPSTTAPANDSQQSRVSSVSSLQTSPHIGQENRSKESSKLEEDEGSENYDDIDYGDDDDDDDFNKTAEDQGSSEAQNYNANLWEENSGLDPGSDESEYEAESSSRKRSNEDDDQESSKDGQTTGGKEQAEKCKYWPACNAGDSCTYYHPTKPCRAFPKCRFGQKCLYIHPPCKFNPNCTKPACPFSHPTNLSGSKRPGSSIFKATQQPLAPRCKYGFNCMNLMCKFSHQRSEPCRFGANCLLETCAYTHPSDVTKKRPASAFKWSAQS